MLNFLSIDSCSSSPSVSIFIKNQLLDTLQIHNISSSGLAKLTSDILFKNKLKISDLNYITVTIGPGSYTGIRVGLSLTQGLCYSSNLPIAPVNILDTFTLGLKIKNDSIFALYSHGDFAFCQFPLENSIKLININQLKNKNVIGMGLEEYKGVINYKEVDFSSAMVGMYSIKNYKKIICEDIGNIEPIYLNEYRSNLKI